MSHKKTKHHPSCLNCHYPLGEFDSFCSNCGQKPTDGKITMHDLFHEFIHTTLHLDGKFFTTLKHIFIPGKLTVEFFRGHHKRYAHPVQLFLVLGALTGGFMLSATAKQEAEMAERQEKSFAKVQRNKMIREVDSLARHLGVRNNQKELFADSLVYKLKFPDLDYQTRTLKSELADNVFDLFENEDSLRRKYKGNYDIAPVEIIDSQTIRFENRVINLHTRHDTIKKNLADSSDSVAESFFEGMKQGFSDDKLTEKKEEIKAIVTQFNDFKDLKTATDLTKEDSVNADFTSFIGNPTALRMPEQEFYETDIDTLVARCKPKGWFENMYYKQAIKLRREGHNLFHYFIGKALWMISLTIPVVALWLMLIYRRQKRYYVEHIVFLMHCNLALFVAAIVLTKIPEKYESWSGWIWLWLMVHFYLAMKNFYGQGYRKTFIKFLSVGFIYQLSAGLVIMILGILSFLLF
jgi:hypothetical protein